MQFNQRFIFFNVLLQLTVVSSELLPINSVTHPLLGDNIELLWRYSDPLAPDDIIFSRNNNDKHSEGKVIGEWSNKNGFKQVKYNLNTETQFQMTKEDGGYLLITLVLVNPSSEDYDMSYYCEIKDKNFSSKIIVDLERPKIEIEIKNITNDNYEFVFKIAYPKEVAAMIFSRNDINGQSVEEICYILFGELSIEDQFKDRIKCNQKEIDKKEIFTITMSNFTNQDSGEYSGYFVFYGGDNRLLLFNVSRGKSSLKEVTTTEVLPEMKSSSSFTFSITHSFYYTVIMQYFFYNLLINT